MALRFEWDPEKAAENLANHGLSFEEAATVFGDPLGRIVDEVRQAWPDTRVGVHHRIGRIEIGEASVIIVAASPHRANAFAACRYTIERVKQIAPIWKREFFDGGDVWIEGATADPENALARAEAERVACA